MWLTHHPVSRRCHHDHSAFGHVHPHVPHSDGSRQPNGSSGSQKIQIGRRILEANDTMAGRLRTLFARHRVFVLNIMSSPGSGKTTLLEKTLSRLMPDLRCAVIVGDIATTHDADRLAVSGAPVVQINTDVFGGDCHLTAQAVEKAMAPFDLTALDLIIVENIGNLVCPAEFDLGEDRRVVVLSVTEGEDKPAKYPLMFRECDAAILNKIDLLPHLDYDVPRVRQAIGQIHPGMRIFEISARTEAGFDPWIAWLKDQAALKKTT
ncbi:hydrogenase nickel incorporation protein HypB [Desulfosarcina sp. OttesenSCG-928-A07]|nr:hydrogenase nickel incorporation protein HypB [Desulfosarcina sp. OttesenSCG-928-A07]